MLQKLYEASKELIEHGVNDAPLGNTKVTLGMDDSTQKKYRQELRARISAKLEEARNNPKKGKLMREYDISCPPKYSNEVEAFRQRGKSSQRGFEGSAGKTLDERIRGRIQGGQQK